MCVKKKHMFATDFNSSALIQKKELFEYLISQGIEITNTNSNTIIQIYQIFVCMKLFDKIGIHY